MLDTIDWPTLAAAVATFITTAFIAWKGWTDKRKEIGVERTTVVGGMIQDNISLRDNTECLRELSDQIEKLRYDVRTNTAALTRATDIALLRRAD